MEQQQLDKIKLELSRMDDAYWEKITERGTALSERAARISAEINDNFTKLAVTQMSIQQAKHTGYKRLAENKKKAAAAGIVKENKEYIDQLTQEKSQALTSLSTLLNELTAIIKELQILGEGGGKNG